MKSQQRLAWAYTTIKRIRKTPLFFLSFPFQKGLLLLLNNKEDEQDEGENFF